MKHLAFVALVVVAVAIGASADAFEGVRCQHTSQCDYAELCIADSPASTWGRCVRIKVLP